MYIIVNIKLQKFLPDVVIKYVGKEFLRYGQMSKKNTCCQKDDTKYLFKI